MSLALPKAILWIEGKSDKPFGTRHKKTCHTRYDKDYCTWFDEAFGTKYNNVWLGHKPFKLIFSLLIPLLIVSYCIFPQPTTQNIYHANNIVVTEETSPCPLLLIKSFFWVVIQKFIVALHRVFFGLWKHLRKTSCTPVVVSILCFVLFVNVPVVFSKNLIFYTFSTQTKKHKLS